MRHARVACLAAALVMGASGCSWFRGKDAPPAEAVAGSETAQAPAAAEPANAEPAAEPAQGPVAVILPKKLLFPRYSPRAHR